MFKYKEAYVRMDAEYWYIRENRKGLGFGFFIYPDWWGDYERFIYYCHNYGSTRSNRRIAEDSLMDAIKKFSYRDF